MIKKSIILAVLASLTACASLTPNVSEMNKSVKSSTKALTEKIISDSSVKSSGLNKAESKDSVPFNAKNNWDNDKGNLSITASGKVSDVLEGFTKRTGYNSVMFVDGIDKNKFVSVSLKSVSAEYAIKKIAYAAGYVAILDKKSGSVTISDQAVYTFKLPSHVFSQMTQSITSNYSAGSGGAAGGGGIGGPVSSGNSSFTVTGKSAGSSGAGGDTGVTKFIKALVGKNAEVSVSEDIGMITIRSNAVALERMRTALNKMAQESSRRVAVEATFIEVSLGDVFEYGIDWKRVLSGSGKAFGVNGGAVSQLANSAANFQYTFNNVTSILTALKQYTDVTVMSQPKIETGNRVPTTFFDGFSIPYLGSIVAIQQQTNTSTSGTVSYADDGVRLSFIPDIVSDSEVHFMLLPTLSSVGAKESFDLGGGSSLTDFVRSKKEALLTVSLEDGQTVIIGGLRSSKSTADKTGIPGVTKKLAIGNKEEASSREVVLLLHANVIAGKPQETLFSESL